MREATVVRRWLYNEKLISMFFSERLVSEVSISEVSMAYNERLAL